MIWCCFLFRIIIYIIPGFQIYVEILTRDALSSHETSNTRNFQHHRDRCVTCKTEQIHHLPLLHYCDPLLQNASRVAMLGLYPQKLTTVSMKLTDFVNGHFRYNRDNAGT